MREFFFSNPEPKAGAIGIGGQDWLGLGQAIGSSSQGTQMCGSKPNCISSLSADCRKRKEQYYQCVDKSLVVASQQVAGGQQTAKDVEDAKRKKVITLAIIGAVTLVVIIVGVVMIKRKRNG